MTTAPAADVVTFGESMALFAADSPGPLAEAAHFTRRLAGADSNVAIGLARLGLRIDWTSRVGDDAFGRFIVDALEAEGIDCERLIVDRQRPTGLQFKSRTDNGSDPETVYFRRGSAASALCPDDLPAARIAACRHLHLTGITAAISASAHALCHHAMNTMRAAGGTISFDPNLRPALWPSHDAMRDAINALAAKADWVLPGIDEGQMLTGSREPGAIADFYLNAGAAEVAIKLGADGAYWQSRHEHVTVAGSAVERIVDTVGAGDGFAVGFISARLDGCSVAAALARANDIGARVIQYPGDSDGLPRREQLER